MKGVGVHPGPLPGWRERDKALNRRVWEVLFSLIKGSEYTPVRYRPRSVLRPLLTVPPCGPCRHFESHRSHNTDMRALLTYCGWGGIINRVEMNAIPR